MGRKDAFTLWMDYELRGNDAVTPGIHQALAGARTLVLFLSEAYMKSSWCREELARFTERAGAEAGRIFVVEVSPLRGSADPLPDLLKYRFWVEDAAGKPRTLGDPRPATPTRYVSTWKRRASRIDASSRPSSSSRSFVRSRIRTACSSVGTRPIRKR